MSDARSARFVAICSGLRSQGMATRDALVSAAHLENAEHPGERPRWSWLWCALPWQHKGECRS